MFVKAMRQASARFRRLINSNSAKNNEALRERFWERFELGELNQAEWEALCDGCGRCCLFKIKDETTKKYGHTNVACRLLDGNSCQCRNYSARTKIVKDCVVLEADMVEKVIDWLPKTCAYRLVHEGNPLHEWHHLISGNRKDVHKAGISVRNFTIPEYEADLSNLSEFVTDWH